MMTWDPRRLARAALALIITIGTMTLLLLTALGVSTGGAESLAVAAGFQGIILAFYFKPDPDESNNSQGGAPSSN